MSLRVAVYGSLRKGFGNHNFLKGSTFEGTTFLSGYTMYSLGGFPGILPGPKESMIYAEIYKIDSRILHTLDCLEGHPDFYKRLTVETPYGKAWLYVLQDKERYTNLPVVSNGEWGSQNL